MFLNLSQSKLAEAIGVKFQQLQKYETGFNRISASRLWEICRVLNVSASYFFDSYKPGKAAPLYGMSDTVQEGFEPEENVMTKKETLKLVREYYAIPDEKVRKDVLKLIRSMAASARNA